MNLDSLVRPNIRSLAPYRSARQDHLEGVLLDANENSLGSVLPLAGVALNRYPDPFQRKLRNALAEREGRAADEIFVGVGSDEAIDLLLRVYCEPGTDHVLIPEPTYGMYRVAASIQNAVIDRVLLTDDFHLDRAAITEALRPDTKLIFVCSPNNPTGNRLRTDDLLWLCRQAPGLVVVDEAYVEFSEAASMAMHIPSVENLVVLRTLSKAWGLAGIRLGYAIAHPAVVRSLLKVKSPYNVNALTARAALEGLRAADKAAAMVRRLREERERLRASLVASPLVVDVLPSDANFLAVRFHDPTVVREALANAGIIVRDRTQEPKLRGCLRITVGAPDENNALLDVISRLAEQRP
ncbi:MAG: histidinol-phosphate transaminase [Bacteroidetes bacterium]|jgi:histidinol-phosphate aminotransferase|nr:histidinol-phosphate transaminase [Bacteroidota bacterium]